MENFKITADEPISVEFRKRGICDFIGAAEYILNLPYRRNPNKNNLLTVFADHCGTCSTKHAVLKLLADENGIQGISLVLGIFKMNAKNTPAVSGTLKKFNLAFVPEAHNYLKYEGKIFDFTKPGFDPSTYVNDIFIEKEIEPNQITDYKVKYHRAFLAQWIHENPDFPYSLDELWSIKEQCIKDLSV